MLANRAVFFFKLLITIFISGSCFLSVIAPYVSPEICWPLALFGLIFIYSYTANLFWVFILFFSNRKWSLYASLPLLLGFSTFLNLWNIKVQKTDVNANRAIKVMSFNVRAFDLYNWTNNVTTREKIFDNLTQTDPSILCLQEFHTSTVKPFKNLEKLQQILKAKNVHTLLPIMQYGTDYWGMATFTEFPILQKKIVFSDLESANGCIATDVLINSDTVRIYNIHLQSVRLRKTDYNFVEKIKEKDKATQIQGIKNIVAKLKTAYKKRAHQVVQITDDITACPYPLILCGDFNDTPASFAYHSLSRHLTDAFLENGIGISATYRGIFPGLRIDYILYSSNFKAVSYSRSKVNISDHFPISANLYHAQ
jgi:endonuclease/exonuclease/phosphatase family metal-dependent hydrolase